MANPSPLSVLKSPAWWAMLLVSIAAVFGDETWLPLLHAPPEVASVFRGIGLAIGVLMMTPVGVWMKGDGRYGGPPAVLAVVLIASPLLTGCATWADHARATIEVSAVAVDVADHAIADSLEQTCAHVAELAAGDERSAALDACLAAHHYDDAITAIRVADRALRAAQAAVDAGERADDPAPWRRIAACVAVAVTEVLAAVHETGVPIPAELKAGASLLAAVTGECSPPERAAA